MTTRIYRVISGHGDKLVRAGSQAQAIRHVVSNTFHARVASQKDMEDMLGSGNKVENAAAEPVAPDANVGGNPLGVDAE
jgi:hypothetical protein